MSGKKGVIVHIDKVGSVHYLFVSRGLSLGLLSMAPRTWNMEDIRARGFRTGSILRVQMHNFITYDDAEVFPGPRLNIILGPNGTGKSTLTHAICLACAGVPSSVGRSDDLRHFIKRGKEVEGCFCEVDLLLKNDTVVTIRRTLNAETKGSKWQLNFKNTTQKEIKELMNNLHIDVDNLCTFMPQDRVSAFTQMNSKKLLQNTLECIKTSNGRNLFDEQKELADSQNTTRDAQREVESQNSHVISLETQIRGMAGEVERIRNRDKLEETVKMYDVRLAVLMLEEKATEVEEKQAAIDAANKELADAHASLQPFEEAYRELQKQQMAHEKSTKSVLEKKLKADEYLDVAREHVEELDIEIETSRMNVETCATMRRQQEDNLRQMNENLQRLDERYQAVLVQVPEVQEQLKVASREYDAASDAVNSINERQNNLRFSLRAPEQAIQDIQSELNKIKDSRAAFCNKLHGQTSKDVRQAMEWIQHNKDRFKGECYGPVGAEVEVKTAADAAMLESVVSYQKLVTFLVDTKEDEQLLNKELRGRLRLSINITTMYNKTFAPQPLPREYLQRARESYGFEGFLGDKFDMPDMVRAYLNSFIGLHTILCTRGPHASQQITHSVIQELATPSFHLFAIDTNANGEVSQIIDYTGKKSRFANGSDDLASSKSISVKPSKLLGMTNHAESQQLKARLEAVLTAARNEFQALEKELLQCREESHSAQVARDEHRTAYKKLKQWLSQPESMKNNLLREEKRRDDLSRKLEIDSGQERERLVELFRNKVTEVVQGVAEIHRRCDTALEATIWKDFTSRASRSVRGELFAAKEALEEAKQRLSELKSLLKSLEKERNIAQDQKLDAEKVISDLEEDLGSEDKLNEFFLRASKEITESSLPDLVAKREQLKGQLEETVDNPELLAQYNKALQDAEEARIRHEQLQQDLNNLQNSVVERERTWVNNVKHIIYKLDKDFSRFMEELKFEGNVGLKETGSFLDYSVEMTVNFRSDGQGGQPLSGLSHSGGERSVATVMYLMALQSLTSAPFRVVDEINQGMDERNERLVFDRIVRSCCTRRTNPLPTSSSSSPSSSSTPVRANVSRPAIPTPSSTGSGVGTSTGDVAATAKAQYFLVSPKLLPGLRAMDNDDVTALMVYNGPGVNDLWQMNDIISALRKRKHNLLVESGKA